MIISSSESFILTPETQAEVNDVNQVNVTFRSACYIAG